MVTATEEQQASLFVVPEDSAFSGALYRPAPELADVASHLMDKFGFLRELINCEIDYLWRRRTGVTKGRRKIGTTRRAGDLLGHYSGKEFIVWLAADTAREAGFTDRAVEWAVFRQLCRISTDEQGNWISVDPDLIAFQAEITHYADVNEDLRLGRRSYLRAEQLGLFDAVSDDDDDDDEDEA